MGELRQMLHLPGTQRASWETPFHIIRATQELPFAVDLPSLTKSLDAGTITVDTVWTAADLITHPEKKDFGFPIYSPLQPWQPRWMNFNTPLHLTIAQGHFDSATVLLELGVDVNAFNVLGRTALHEAVAEQSLRAAAFLLAKNADANARSTGGEVKDKDGEKKAQKGVTPLAESVYMGDVDMAKKLLEAGANPNLVLDGGWTALDLALIADEVEIADVLQEAGGELSVKLGDEALEISGFNARLTMLESSVDILPSENCYQAYREIVRKLLPAVVPDGYPPGQIPTADLIQKMTNVIARELDSPRPHRDMADPKCDTCKRLEREGARSPLPFNEIYARGNAPSYTQLQLAQTTSEKAPEYWISLFEHSASREALVRSADAGCPLCRELDYTLSVGMMMTNPEWIKFSQHAGEIVYVSCNVAPEGHSSISVYWKSIAKSLSLNYIPGKFSSNNVRGTGSQTPAQLAGNFMNHCASTHDHVKRLTDGTTPLPFAVIDVGENLTDLSSPSRLILGNSILAPYIALSHPSTGALLNNAMLLSPSLHPAVRDAIAFTRGIGHRYLWVENAALRKPATPEDPLATPTATLSILARAAAVLFPPPDGEVDERGLFRARTEPATELLPFGARMTRSQKKWGRGAVAAALYALPAFMVQDVNDQMNNRLHRLGGERLSPRERVAMRSVWFSRDGILRWECGYMSGSEINPDGKGAGGLGRRRNEMVDKSELRALVGLELAAKEDEMWSSRKMEVPYDVWKRMSEFEPESRTPNATDDILALGRLLEPAFGERFVVGIWTGEHCLESLLWHVIMPGDLDPRYPSWSWASTSAPVVHGTYTADPKNWWPRTWIASVISIDANSTDSSGAYDGRLVLSGSLKRVSDEFVPEEFEVSEEVRDSYGSGHYVPGYMVPEGMTTDELLNRTVIDGFMDRRHREGEGGDYWLFPFISVSAMAVPHPDDVTSWEKGRPKSVICLCLQSVDADARVFRRVGIRELWDTEEFWEGFAHDQSVTVI